MSIYLFSYRFNGISLAWKGNVLDNEQTATAFNQTNFGMDKMPSIGKQRLLRKKFKQLFMSALQKNKSP